MNIIDTLEFLREQSYTLCYEGRISSVEMGQFCSAVNLLKMYTYKFDLEKDCDGSL